MYTLIRQMSPRSLVWIQTPAFVVSFAIATFFYKLGSFALECVAFLATWFVVDFVITTVGQIVLDRRSPSPGTR